MPGTDTPRGLDSGNHAAAAASDPPAIPVHVVSPVCLYRDGLVALLERDEGIEVVGRADGIAATLRLAASDPALVLYDAMTAESDAEIRRLRRELPDVPVVALTVPN